MRHPDRVELIEAGIYELRRPGGVRKSWQTGCVTQINNPSIFFISPCLGETVTGGIYREKIN